MNNIFKITGLGEVRQYTNQKGITSHCRDIQLQQLGGKFADRFTSTLFDAETEKELEVGASSQHSSTSTQRSITIRCSRT